MISSTLARSLPPQTQTDELRLLLIAHNHPDIFPGGAEMFAHRLFQHFKSQDDVQPSFIAATDPAHSTLYSGTPLTAYAGKDDEMLLQAGAFDYFTQSLRNSQVLTEHLANYLREVQPDIIHIHHTMRVGMEVLAVIKNTLPRAKIIYTLHDFIPLCHRDGQMVRSDETLCETSGAENCHRCFPDISSAKFKIREQLIRSYFDRVDAFISPSRFLAQRFVAWGLPEEKVHVIANGIPTVSSAPQRKLAKKDPRNRFSYFGQITPYKGLLLLCDAARLLQSGESNNISINIYGNVEEQTQEFQQQFMQAVEQAGDCVTWHGRYRQEDMASLMADTDWVIVPSTWWENAPLVIDEAFAHKRPVICADIGGMAEKVVHRKNGFHFRHNSADSLASVISDAANNPEMWQRLVRGISPPATIEDSAAEHTALYRSLMDS